MLPTKPVGNPDITSEPDLTQSFENVLRDLGFKVIDAYFVNGTMVELGINSEEELSPVDMIKLQKELNCSAFCKTTRIFALNSETSEVQSTLYKHTEERALKGKYYKNSISLTIIVPLSLTTLVSIKKNRVTGRSMFYDIVTLLEEHFNKLESTQSK